jgi:predicted CXXCH cytochrome family protein
MRRAFYIFFCVQLIILSCSTNRNYKTLSFFFDGVPEPSFSQEDTLAEENIPEAENELLSISNIPAESRIYHEPYRLRGCSNCHLQSSVSNMKEKEPGLCYQCHKDFSELYKYVHGPVQGGFCTSCHSPHSSSENALLLKPGKEICAICHNSTNLSSIPVHGLDKVESCLDCHNPHGGESNLLMRSKR